MARYLALTNHRGPKIVMISSIDAGITADCVDRYLSSRMTTWLLRIVRIAWRKTFQFRWIIDDRARSTQESHWKNELGVSFFQRSCMNGSGVCFISYLRNAQWMFSLLSSGLFYRKIVWTKTNEQNNNAVSKEVCSYLVHSHLHGMAAMLILLHVVGWLFVTVLMLILISRARQLTCL